MDDWTVNADDDADDVIDGATEPAAGVSLGPGLVVAALVDEPQQQRMSAKAITPVARTAVSITLRLRIFPIRPAVTT
jgi:hypothetical protein